MEAHSYAVKIRKQSSFATTPHRVFTTSTPKLTKAYHVTFNFSCETIIRDRISYDYSTADFITEHPRSVINKSFCHYLNSDALDIQQTQKAIARELIHWSLPEALLGCMITKTVYKTIRIIRCSRPHNNFIVNVQVIHKNDRTFFESFPRMIPATDESIKNLERRMMTDSNLINGPGCESCLICLEDFCSGCEVVNMPCSHAFHGECIETWLKTSHFCPLCRLEMPTTLA